MDWLTTESPRVRRWALVAMFFGDALMFVGACWLIWRLVFMLMTQGGR